MRGEIPAPVIERTYMKDKNIGDLIVNVDLTETQKLIQDLKQNTADFKAAIEKFNAEFVTSISFS